MSTFMQMQILSNILENSNPAIIKAVDGNDINMDSGYRVLNNHKFSRRVLIDNQDDVIKKLSISKNLTEETEGLGYSSITTELFDYYKKDSNIVGNFEFRESLFVNFIENMAGATFHELAMNQLENVYLTQTHVDYLIETFHYLFLDRARQVNNNSWITILYHRKAQPLKAYEKLADFFRFQVMLDPKKDRAPELVRRWMIKDGGVVDLLFFNKLVFGLTQLNRIS